jgi:hypothetical protein
MQIYSKRIVILCTDFSEIIILSNYRYMEKKTVQIKWWENLAGIKY